MPSGKKDVYGVPTKGLYKAGAMKAARAAEANADPARARAAMQRLAQEGTTSARGGSPVATKKQPQIIKTTVNERMTPFGKRK